MRPCVHPTQDFERERNAERVLQSMSLKRFAALIFRECPGLAPFAGSLDKIYKAFAEYKQARSTKGLGFLGSAQGSAGKAAPLPWLLRTVCYDGHSLLAAMTATTVDGVLL